MLNNKPLNQSEKTSPSREVWMDIFKGFAIILVVLVHVFRGLTLASLGRESQSFFAYADYTICTFLMPMFFMISGALFSKEKKLTGLNDYKKLLYKKLIRLGIPYVIFSCLQGLLRLTLNGQTNVPFTPQKLLLIPFIPFDHFWFIYALLLIFWLVPLMELAIKNEYVILVLLFSFNVLSTTLNTQWPIGFFFVYGFYFYLGTLLYRHHKHLLSNIPLMLGMSLVYCVMNPLCHGLDANPTVLSTIFLFIGMAIAGSFMCILASQFVFNRVPLTNRLLTALGHYSFEIYLLHSLVTSSSRMVLVKIFHIYSTPVHVAVGLTFGLLIPMAIVVVGKKIPLVNFAFYPAQYLDKKKKSTEKAPMPVPA